MSKPMHKHKSDADFVLDVAKRLRRVPVSYGLNGFDIDCLADLSSRLRKSERSSHDDDAEVLKAACHAASVNWTLSGEQILRVYLQVNAMKDAIRSQFGTQKEKQE